jgi:hypothetical protein
MDNSLPSSEPHTAAERLMERTIFASRWLLAPFYVGLAVSLVVLLIKFGQKTVKLLSDAFPSGSNEVITNVLSLIDLCLIASLVLMVILACYEKTRRRFDTINGVSLRNLTWEPTGVVEYVIPGAWLGGADAARMLGQSGPRLRRRGGEKLVEHIGARV